MRSHLKDRRIKMSRRAPIELPFLFHVSSAKAVVERVRLSLIEVQNHSRCISSHRAPRHAHFYSPETFKVRRRFIPVYFYVPISPSVMFCIRYCVSFRSRSCTHNRFKYGKLYYRFRKAWRRIPIKKYRLFTHLRRKWRRIIRRGRKIVVRIGRKYTGVRINRRTISYRRGRRWIRIRRRKGVRRTRRPWRRRRRVRRRRFGLMRVYVRRSWRTVYKRRGTFYFRYGGRSCSLR